VEYLYNSAYSLWIRSNILPVLLIGAVLSEINLTLVKGNVPVRISIGDLIIMGTILGYLFFSWGNLKKIAAENIIIVVTGLTFIFISLITSSIDNAYWLVSLKFCIKVCILFFLLALIYQDSIISRGTLSALLVIMICINAIGILEYFYCDRMKDFLLLFKSEESLVPHRHMHVSSIFPNTNTFSVFNAIFIVTILGITLHHGRLVNRYLCGICLLLCMAGLFLSSSRNGILTVVTGISLLAVSLARRRGALGKAFTVIVCALAILVAAFSAHKPLAKRFADLVSLAPMALNGQSLGTKEVSSALRLKERLVIWENGQALFLEKPVFGIGASQFIMRNDHKGGRTIHMHNIFGDILVNHGIVGFALFMALVAAWFKNAKGDWQVYLIITLFVSHMFDCFAPYNTIWLIFTPWLVALTTRKPDEMFLLDGIDQPDQPAVIAK